MKDDTWWAPADQAVTVTVNVPDTEDPTGSQEPASRWDSKIRQTRCSAEGKVIPRGGGAEWLGCRTQGGARARAEGCGCGGGSVRGAGDHEHRRDLGDPRHEHARPPRLEEGGSASSHSGSSCIHAQHKSLELATQERKEMSLMKGGAAGLPLWAARAKGRPSCSARRAYASGFGGSVTHTGMSRPLRASKRHWTRKAAVPSNENKSSGVPGSRLGGRRALSPCRVRRPVKRLTGQIRVSLNLKDEVITEPELTAGHALWNLIKARGGASCQNCGKERTPGALSELSGAEQSKEEVGRDRRRPSHAEGSQAWAGAVVPTSLQPGSETVPGWQVSPPAPLWRLVTCASTHTHAYIMGPCALAHAMHTHTGTRTSHSIRGDLCHLCHKTERPRLPAVVLQQRGAPCCLS